MFFWDAIAIVKTANWSNGEIDVKQRISDAVQHYNELFNVISKNV